MELQKLTISIYDEELERLKKIKETGNFFIDTFQSLEVMYNPTTMHYFKELSWIDSGSRGGQLRLKQYDNMKFQKLKVQLFFDFTMVNNDFFIKYFYFFEFITREVVPFYSRGDKDKADSSRLLNLFRPPVLTLSWGETDTLLHFKSCIITKLDWNYKMFDRAGNVLRATADITFEEIRYDLGINFEADKSKRGTFLGRIKKI